MKENIRSIAGALCLAVMYVSSIYLIAAISYKSVTGAVIYALFIAAAYFLTLISPDKKKWLLKYLLSVPLSFGVIWYFWLTEYSVRALNWTYPDYGRFSAGGNFNGLVQVISFSALCLVAIIAGPDEKILIVSHGCLLGFTGPSLRIVFEPECGDPVQSRA